VGLRLADLLREVRGE